MTQQNIKRGLIKGASYLPFSVNHLASIQVAYKAGGQPFGVALASAIALDKALIDKGLQSKHYFSLSALWSAIGYKSIMAVQNSSIGFKYKIALQVVFGALSAGMVYYGKDSFESKSDFGKSIKSILFTAKILDAETGVVSGLEAAYEAGSIPAIKYGLQNLRSLVQNPFIRIVLMRQGLDIGKTLLLHKFFMDGNINKSTIYGLIKNDNDGFSKFLKLSLYQFVNKLVDLASKKAEGALSKKVESQIAEKVADLAFNQNKTPEIMATTNINLISSEMDNVQQEAMSDISNTSRTITMSIMNMRLEHSGLKVGPFDYPTLFLLSATVEGFVEQSIQTLQAFLTSRVFSKAINPMEEFRDFEMQKIGNAQLRVHRDVKETAYSNIQEIAVMGGLPFMLQRVKLFIRANADHTGDDQNNILSAFIDSLKDFMVNLCYASQFHMLDFESPDDILQLDQSIKETLSILGIQGAVTSFPQSIDTLANLQTKFDALTNHKREGPTRSNSSDMSLRITDYKLFLSEGSKHILHIDKDHPLVFFPGIVYAIKGPIGTGKTTFLTDIACCLSGDFYSYGEISYPTSHGEALPKIFCRIKSFAFPKVSFFEKLTYRMPKEYADEHHDELITQAKTLFEKMGQKTFADKIDFDTRNKHEFGSTGQEKITILIAVILYKQYLGKPVLLALDETLANLDDETRDLICEEIKKQFSDSIVLSVDHQAGHNPFYDEIVDLAEYRVNPLGDSMD